MKKYEKMEISDLQKEITGKNDGLLDMRFQLVSNELKDTTQIQKTKKEIARIKTFINQKRRQESEHASTKSEKN